MVAPLEIGRDRQLFIDDHVIDRTDGVVRTLNQPAKYVGNPIMIPLYPWEGRVELYGTVRRDPDGGFRMWYTGLGGMGVRAMSNFWIRCSTVAQNNLTVDSRSCLAFSSTSCRC